MATQAEVLAAEALHQAAQARLGFAAAFMALAEWEAVTALNPVETSAQFLTFSLKAIVAIRKMSRRLAVAHYQLIRALETGRTLGVPEGSPQGPVTIDALRTNFRDAAIDVAALPSPRTRSDDPDIRWFEETLASIPPERVPSAINLDDLEVDPLIQDFLDAEGPADTKTIPVDKYDWPTDLTLKEVEDAYRELLRKQSVTTVSAKVQEVRSSVGLSPDEVIGQIEEVHASAGSIGSGIVDALGVNAGRDAVIGAVKSDRLVLAVARGTGPDPCAFCSMLASRGFVYSESTAGVGNAEEIVKYHIHCHCYPIYRYVRESELPPLSRYFQEKWRDVTDGYSGNDARKAWRRWIYAQRKANPGAPHGVQVTS
jgi:hypothetical protein